MSLSILFDDAIDSCHIQIFMKVVIANVPRGIHDTTEHSILVFLDTLKNCIPASQNTPSHRTTGPINAALKLSLVYSENHIQEINTFSGQNGECV
jgi:hypothetical protein